MFIRFRDIFGGAGDGQGNPLSLTDYFDDTVSKVVRTHRKRLFLNEPVDETMCEPANVAGFILYQGRQISTAWQQPGRNTHFADATFEEGVLTACDISRKTIGLDLKSVMYRPGEIERLTGPVIP